MPRGQPRAHILSDRANATSIKRDGRKAKAILYPDVFELIEVVVKLKDVHPSLEDEVMFIRDVAGAVVQLLCDPSVSGPNSQNLDFGQAGGDNVMSGCKYVQVLQEALNIKLNAPVGTAGYLVTVCIFADGVSVRAGYEKSFVPVSISLAQHSLDVRLSLDGSALLGYENFWKGRLQKN